MTPSDELAPPARGTSALDPAPTPLPAPDPSAPREGAVDAAAAGASRRNVLGFVSRHAAAIWVVVVGLITLPILVGLQTGSLLDSSWMLGLQLAHAQGLHWGTQVSWTYGPLGFLTVWYPSDTLTWLIGLLARLAVHFLFLGTLASTLRRVRAPAWIWVAATVAFVVDGYAIGFPLGFLNEAPTLAVLLLWGCLDTTIDPGRQQLAMASAAGLLLAVMVLTKESFMLLAPALLVVFVLAGLIRRRGRAVVATLATLVLALVALWAATGQSVDGVVPFVRTSISVSSGYSEAMQLGGVDVWVLAGVAVPAALAALALLSWWRAWWRALIMVLFLLPLTVIEFKEGFVREEALSGHPQLAFGGYVLVSVLVLVALAAEPARHETTRRAVWGVACAVLLGAVCIGVPNTPTPLLGVGDRVSQVRMSVHLLVSPSYRRFVHDQLDGQIRAEAPLPSTVLSAVSGHSVDIMPTSIAVLYAYGLDWRPRPVLQSYSAYTPYLDQLDAAFLAGPDAPDRIIYSPGSIDARMPLWDEPSALRTLLSRYEPITPVADGMVVLARRPVPIDLSTTEVGHTCASFGQPIAVPTTASRWMFARIDMPMSLWGRLRTTALRAPVVTVDIIRADGSTDEFRFLPTTATDGVILTDTSPAATAIPQLFQGGATGDAARSLQFSVGSPRVFVTPVCVTFLSAG